MAFNTIRVQAYQPHHEEWQAKAAVTPGHLVEHVVNATTIQVHSGANKNVPVVMFALEDELRGNDITDAYKADDKVQVWIPRSGDFVYAIIGRNNTIQIGHILTSKGDGTLQKAPADATATTQVHVDNIVGVALEAVTVADTAGATGRCLIQVR